MAIPYRDEQILRILAGRPAGMTTGEIMAIAKAQPGNELPNSNICSQRIFALKATKIPKIASIDTPAGLLHKLTSVGRGLLADLDRDNPDSANQAEHAAADPVAQTERGEDPEAPKPITVETLSFSTDDAAAAQHHVLLQFDAVAAKIRTVLAATLDNASTQISIKDKREKIDLLEKLENMPLLEPWAADLIAEIRADITQLDEV